MTDRENTDEPKVRAYCASCQKNLGSELEEYIGERFRCPHATRLEPHVAYVVADPEISWWLKLEVWLLKYQSRWSPLRWIPCFRAKKRKGKVEAYLLLKFMLLAVLLSLHQIKVPGIVFLSVPYALFVVFDLLAAMTSGVFTSRWPALPLRTVILSMLSFVELVLAFALLYAAQVSDFNLTNLNVGQIIYFSFVTGTTLGYGDIFPKLDCLLLQSTVIFQILTGLYFIVVLLAGSVVWIGDRPSLKELNQVCEEDEDQTA